MIVDLRLAPVERVFEQRARFLFELRRVSIARHEDVASDESLEDVLAREERHAMTLLKLKDAPSDLKEIAVRDLKHFVARKGLEDVDERFAVVRMRIESGALDDASRFQPQHRNLAHAAAVCGRGEEAEEAIFADQVSVRVVTLDADAIHRHGAMHEAAAVRLRDDQEILATRVLAELGRQRLFGSLDRFRTHFAKDAETALRNGGQEVFVIARLERVSAIAEEDEIAVVEPFEKFARFIDFFGGHRQLRAFQLCDQRFELCACRFEVDHRESHFTEDSLER